MLLNMLDTFRILIVCVAFYFGYNIGFSQNEYDPISQLHFMIPIIIFSIAGISGFEGLFFAKKSADNKGFETGSNYQRQSAIALLSYAVVAIIYIINWGIKAELTVFFAFIFFFFFSGINHAFDAIKNKNYKWQNINRPFITLILILGMIYPIIMALRSF